MAGEPVVHVVDDGDAARDALAFLLNRCGQALGPRLQGFP